MCGIAGRINLRSHRPVDQASIRQMCDWIRHRGPDDEGTLVDGEAGFGHRRLSIIDLSPGGHQPMVSRSGRYWITFNGEIYNYLEIRAQLETRGFVFRSSSDTEVLLAAFEAWDVDCLRHLRGMFAFGIWDTVDRRLFLARDRVGKKPLYYREDRDGIAFASESRAFFADPGFEPQANPAAISAFVSLQYVPAPLSAFKGVRCLPPAHYLVATAASTTVNRYWKLEYEPKNQLTEDEAEEEFVPILREAIRLRLISDVPLGAFLSGGVDSSVVVALMCEIGGQAGRVRTFSIGFDEEQFNELPYARMVAARYGTEHTEHVVKPDIQQLLPRLVWHFSEPFADESAIPTFWLSKMTRQHVTVALNGDGGDENFAGYDRYAVNARNARFERLPRALRVLIAKSMAALPGASADRLQTWAALRAMRSDEQAAMNRMFLSGRQKRSLLTPEFLSAGAPDAALEILSSSFRSASADEQMDRLLAMDAETYLPGALLPKVDITTMAFALEGRSPLLDHKVMEFAARLPLPLKRQGTDGKRLLKRIARRLVPTEVVDRPKRGFSVPLRHWFRHELADTVRDVLLGSAARSRGVLEPKGVETLLGEHMSGARDWHEEIWILLMQELWYQTFIDRRPAPTI